MIAAFNCKISAIYLTICYYFIIFILRPPDSQKCLKIPSPVNGYTVSSVECTVIILIFVYEITCIDVA